MLNVIPGKDSTQEESEKNNSFNKSIPTKRNLWYVDIDLRKQFNLSFVEAAFYCMIVQLQCTKNGFCWAKNYYFMDALDLSDKWIERALQKLADLNLIWVHYYNTKYGTRRQIVTAESIRTYQQFLKRTTNWNLLRKFQKEFATISTPINDPNDPKIPIPKETPEISENESQVIKLIPPDKEVHRPPAKMSDDPPAKMSDAINTTYLPNKKNSVTCKKEDAAFPLELKKELEQVCSKEDVVLGLKWYDIQTEARKENMKNPIACIINAIKKGYCREKVEEHDNLLAEQKEKKHQQIQKLKTKKKEFSENEKFAHKIINEFQRNKGFRPRMAKEFFVIFNDSLEKHRDLETSTPYFELPSGEKHYGAKAAIKVDFNQPSSTFKKEIKKFLLLNNWVSQELRRVG